MKSGLAGYCQPVFFMATRKKTVFAQLREDQNLISGTT